MRFLLLLSFCSCFLFGQNNPDLQCVSPQGTNVVLEWTYTDNCPGGFDYIEINGNVTDSGAFTVVATITDPTQLTYVHDTSVDGFTCFFLTLYCGDGSVEGFSQDKVCLDALLAPSIDYVTVENGMVEIYWTNVIALPDYGAQLYVYDDSGPFFVDLDQETDNLITLYTDVTQDPTIESQQYDIAALNACGTVGASSGNPHSTIFLSGDIDFCNRTIDFVYSDYEGWSNLTSYNLYRDGVLNDSQPGFASTNSFAYDIIDGTDNGQVCFHIEAIGGSNGSVLTSKSNVFCIDFDLPGLPTYLYMTNASVNSDNSIDVDWMIDENGVFHELWLNRGRELTEIDLLENFGNVVTTPTMNHNDSGASPQFYDYYYSVTAHDSCAGDVLSGTAKTILLTLQNQINAANDIQWTAFDIDNPGGSITVKGYNIYRSDNDAFIFTTVSGSTMNFLDDISSLPVTSEGLCYRVEAIFDLTLPDGTMITDQTSFSNEVCSLQYSQIVMPNSFVPNGVNRIFQPALTFPNYENYRFLVINRWGEILFETDNPDDGWNGQNEGNPVPQGVYAYVVQMKSVNGIDLEKKGTVLLVR